MAERKIDEICEIECLNLDDLDVEELERRLEMSAGISPHFEECTTDSAGCTSDCSTNVCVGACTNLCACDGACGIHIY